MKTQDKKALQTKTKEELMKLLQEARKALSALRFEHVQNKVKDTSSITNKRKEIAVLLTILQGKSTDAPSVAKAMDGKKALADKEGGNKNG